VLYLTLNPITAMVLGVAVLGETLTVELLLGMALVLLAILVGNGLPGRKRSSDPEPSRRMN
jgi:drug/metabolite transporter (DMT)-like permease